MVAFAGNSILCRVALLPGDAGATGPDAELAAGPAMGPGAFTAIRLLSGALALLPLVLRTRAEPAPDSSGRQSPPWLAAAVLVVYAITFSFSYVTIPAGVGALVLFGTVQVVMLAVALLRGERLRPLQLGGFLAAVAGLLVVIGPSASRSAGDVDLVGALLMVVSGIGWALYTLLGRGARAPATMTARNFLLSVPFAVAVGAWSLFGGEAPPSSRGVLLAVLSGAVTSGAGYILWYTALAGHTRTSAAAVQLLVPIIASLGGVVLLDEVLTPRLLLGTWLVLGGVGLAVLMPKRGPRPAASA